MGDDTALPPLAGRIRPLFGFFRQRFAQVTNPAIDHVRERRVMSLRTLLGARGLLTEEEPAAAQLFELDTFLLYPSALPALRTSLDATVRGGEGLVDACARVVAEAVQGVSAGREVLLLSDGATARDARRFRRCSRSPLCTTGSSRPDCVRTRRSSCRATSHRRRTTSRACSASVPTRSARASRSRRSPSSPPRTSSAATTIAEAQGATARRSRTGC